MTTTMPRESAMRFAEGGTGSVTEIPAPSAGDPSPDQASSYRRATLSLVALTTSIFLTFMTIGLPLPIIPLYVGHVLLLGNVVVGLSSRAFSIRTRIPDRSLSGC